MEVGLFSELNMKTKCIFFCNLVKVTNRKEKFDMTNGGTDPHDRLSFYFTLFCVFWNYYRQQSQWDAQKVQASNFPKT